MSAPRCYALRRLNPYLGVTEVIETEVGRALSVDGSNWEIQLRGQPPPSWGVLNRGADERCYFRFGVWSQQEGMARFPPARNIDPQSAERQAAAILATIASVVAALPFPLADTLECWLLDARGKPLALLASRLPESGPVDLRSRRWQPALPDPDWPGAAHFSALAGWVAQQALPTPCWIERRADGSGDAVGERKLSFGAEDFPELLFALPPVADNARQALAEDYLAWLAPRLLMLPLTPSLRARLERAASGQPEAVERFHRLYPAVADGAWLKTMRVQARLEQAAR